jgi:hypothetical protein
VRKLYDELDFQRAVLAYQYAQPLVAFHELNVGFKQLGVDEGDLIVMERFLDPRGLALTGNSTTIYAMSYLDLDQNGPMVVEVSAGSYGAIFDLWQQPIAEIGPLGVDKGAGGKFLIMPRNRADPPPAGYLPVPSRTSLAALFARGIVNDDDVDGAAKSLEGIRVYPLTQATIRPRPRSCWPQAGTSTRSSLRASSTGGGSHWSWSAWKRPGWRVLALDSESPRDRTRRTVPARCAPAGHPG